MGNRNIMTQFAFSEYENRFMKALIEHPLRRPWETKDRQDIIEGTRKCLGIRDDLIPGINEQVIRVVQYSGYSVRLMTYESWDHVYGTANLYVPDTPAGGSKCPVIVVCCGHADECRLAPGYQAMARRLVRQGAYVLINDNIGQGERKPMGHKDSVGPFYCGLSVQGLIVMETLAWIKHLAEYPFIDATRMGVCGNSGGGTLALFLAALSEDISALNSSGYPSCFWWLGAKEKRHCHCNIIPHSLSEIEMWELYSVFAPRPLLLLQGSFDNLLPEDLFYKNARNVRTVYAEMNAVDQFKAQVYPGTHAWDTQRRQAIGEFFSQVFNMAPTEIMPEGADITDTLDPAAKTSELPEDFLTTDELAQKLTGIIMPEGTRLCDIYKPKYQGDELKADELDIKIDRGETMQVLAQFEAFL